jgi:hypothetical protein
MHQLIAVDDEARLYTKHMVLCINNVEQFMSWRTWFY